MDNKYPFRGIQLDKKYPILLDIGEELFINSVQ